MGKVMTHPEFTSLVEGRRYKPRMKRAMRLVLVNDYSPAAAAKVVGTTRQAIHQALMGVAAELEFCDKCGSVIGLRR